MTFHVPSTQGGGWIVRTPHGVRLEMTEYPSCLNAGEKAAFAKACSSTREQIRGFGAGPQFGPMRARNPACAMAARPTCKPTPCLDVPALNRLLDNVKNRARGAWALWGMTPEAHAMQLGVACSKISPPKCLNSEQQKLLNYFKQHGWSGPDVEMNGRVWVTRAQTPTFFQRPRCLIQLPQIPKRKAPQPRKLVQLPQIPQHRAAPPPQRIAVQRVAPMPVKLPPRRKRHCGDMWSPSGLKYCARMSDAFAKSLKQRLEAPGYPPSKCAAILQLDSHGFLNRKNREVLVMLKACMPRPGRVSVEARRLPIKASPPPSKSPEAPAPIMAPPAYVPTPTPSAPPAPSPEAPAPVLAPPSEPAPSSEIVEPVVEPEIMETAPELPGGEEQVESKPFPWWMVAVAVGGGYYLYKRSKKRR